MTDQIQQPVPEEMFAVLAHELRTPLSTIEGYLELLTNGGVGSLTDEQREYLDVVSRNIRRMVTVVGDWADVCRLEAGRFDLVQEEVDLVETVDRAVADLRPRIRAKEQRLRVQTPSEPVLVRGDTRAVRRVMDNLLSNAHKYTQPSGSIRIGLAFERHDTVRLDVEDTGIGLRDEDQARLFRKFFRASLTEAEPGTGLGLALSRSLVERMGGSISVTSALGKGSMFTILLPRIVRAGAGEIPEASASVTA
ncbi:MAG: sensor histidine kinase [Chloroflexota bacterium]